MSSPDAARRAIGKVVFNGVDITDDIKKYLLTLSYTDNEEDESDDLQITLQDRDGVWIESWLQEMLEAAASSGGNATEEASLDYPTVRFGSQGDTVKIMQNYLVALGEELPKYGVDGYFGSETQAAVKSFQTKNGLSVDGICGPKTWAKIAELSSPQSAGGGAAGFSIQASIIRQNWNGGGKDKVLDCGTFELDDVSCSGPPSTVSLRAAALPFSSQIRQTEVSKAWEDYYLSKIAEEMASSNGMSCMFLADEDPLYKRVEQYRQSDIAFLSKLCHDAGLSLKATNNMLVIFDQAKYEASTPALAITKGDGSYTKYKLNIGKSDVQYATCRVSYTDPATGSCITGIAYAEGYKDNAKNNQQLNVYAAVHSVGEATALAEKTLRLHNKYEKTTTFTMPGNPDIVAGITATVKGFGAFDGKYIIKQAKHQIGGSGYTTQVTMRPVLAAGETIS